MGLTIIPKEQLEKRNVKNLLYILKQARAYLGYQRNSIYCDCCGEFLGSKEELERLHAGFKPYEDYVRDLKAVLATKEHVDRPGKPPRRTYRFKT